MKCPHCAVQVHPETRRGFFSHGDHYAEVGGGYWAYSYMTCPSCQRPIIWLQTHPDIQALQFLVQRDLGRMVIPKGATRPAAPPEVPQAAAEDFNEACLVLADSPKASAALSRRCLQAVLRDQGYNQHDLAKAIDAILAAKVLPPAVADNLDAVRNIGNFAAHPMKDTNSGALLDVEPHEAGWNLDVLEELFDVLYVQPAAAQKKRDTLNAKLAAAGKPPMK